MVVVVVVVEVIFVVEVMVVLEVVMEVGVDRMVAAVVVMVVVELSKNPTELKAKTSTIKPSKTLRAIRAVDRQNCQLRFFRVATCPCSLTG